MAATNWAVRKTVDPALKPGQPIPVGAKIVGDLRAALADAPAEDWRLFARGQEVSSIAEFQKLVDEAESIEPGEYWAQANGITVESV